MNSAHPQVIIVMGVSGAGKTTVGAALAEHLGWTFLDADDFHPRQNIAKMSRGEPLTDDDRGPWLVSLGNRILDALAAGEPVVLAISALKTSYREQLHAGDPRVALVYLRGTYDMIHRRMMQRSDHFFDAELLSSQFAALEEPADAVVVEIHLPVAEIVNSIRLQLDL